MISHGNTCSWWRSVFETNFFSLSFSLFSHPPPNPNSRYCTFSLVLCPVPTYIVLYNYRYTIYPIHALQIGLPGFAKSLNCSVFNLQLIHPLSHATPFIHFIHNNTHNLYPYLHPIPPLPLSSRLDFFRRFGLHCRWSFFTPGK